MPLPKFSQEKEAGGHGNSKFSVDFFYIYICISKLKEPQSDGLSVTCTLL